MHLTSCPRYMRPPSRAVLCAITIIALTGLAAGNASAPAAESGPVLVVPPSKVTLHLAVPLPEGVNLQPADAWQLVEIELPEVRTPAQLVPAIAADGTAAESGGRLVADILPRKGVSQPRRFRLEPAKAAAVDAAKGFRLEDLDNKSLKLSDGDSPLLVYNYGVITNEAVPEGNHLRSRGCYVHPLWGLHGEVLTDDFPKDHYHHHGIFWTWPHIGIEGKEYNLWAGDNIKDEFVRWICRETGPVAAVLAVENGWFVDEQKVMIERVWLRAHKVSGFARSVDFEFTWIPAERPVTLWGAGGKSYGGLTVRFAPRSREDTVITVPSGRTTADLPDTRLKWADLTSRFGDAAVPSGAAVFVHPDHPDYPPSWLTRHYGPLCVGWPGVKPKTFEPDKPIRLDYRIWIHKTALEVDTLKEGYQGYTASTKVKWE